MFDVKKRRSRCPKCGGQLIIDKWSANAPAIIRCFNCGLRDDSSKYWDANLEEFVPNPMYSGMDIKVKWTKQRQQHANH